jgi:hypothetical protein
MLARKDIINCWNMHNTVQAVGLDRTEFRHKRSAAPDATPLSQRQYDLDRRPHQKLRTAPSSPFSASSDPFTDHNSSPASTELWGDEGVEEAINSILTSPAHQHLPDLQKLTVGEMLRGLCTAPEDDDLRDRASTATSYTQPPQVTTTTIASDSTLERVDCIEKAVLSMSKRQEVLAQKIDQIAMQSSHANAQSDLRLEEALLAIKQLSHGLSKIYALVSGNNKPPQGQDKPMQLNTPQIKRADLPTAATRPQVPAKDREEEEKAKRRDALYDKLNADGTKRREWLASDLEYDIPDCIKSRKSYVSIARRAEQDRPSTAQQQPAPQAQQPQKPPKHQHQRALVQQQAPPHKQGWNTVRRDRDGKHEAKKTEAVTIRQKNLDKPFSEAQLMRILNGELPRADRNIIAIYATGLKAQPVSVMKRLLKGNLGVPLRHIAHIGFLDKELLELHVFEDFVAKLKELITEPLHLKWVELDLVATGVSKDAYIESMRTRLEVTPIASHRKLLRGIIDGTQHSTHPLDPSKDVNGDSPMLA